MSPTAPNLTNSSNGNWTNKDVTITMNSQDNTSGVVSYEWFENEAWTTKEINIQNRVGTITYTTEREIEVRYRAKDEAGNYSVESKTGIKIDKTKPLAFIPTAKATTNTITLEGKTTDALSQVKGYSFSKDNGTSWTEIQTKSNYVFEGLTQNTQYSLKMKAIDYAGNEIVTDTISKTTATVPTGSENIVLTPSWENGSCKVTLTTAQTGYVLQYKIGEAEGNWTNYNSAVTVGLNQTIYARLWDGTNGGSTASLKVTDTAAPTAPKTEVSQATAGSNGWYKSDVTVKVTAGTDNQTGIERTVYSVTGTAKTAGKIGEVSVQAGNVNIGETTITSGNTFKITVDGTFTVTASSYDKAGNKSALATLVIKKDATPPTGSLAATSTKTKSITVKVAATDNTSGLANTNTYQYYYKKKTDTNYTLATTTTENTYTYPNLAQTTTYQLYVVVTDNAGLTVESNIVNQATGTVPAGIGNVTLTPAWSSGTCKVALGTSQTGYTIQYQIGGTAGTWNNYSSPVTVGLNQTIYARLWDGTNGGSTASLKVTDVTAPTIPKAEVVSGTAGENGWYTSAVTIKVTAGEDNQTGVDRTTYTLTGATSKAETTIASGATFSVTADGITTVTCYTYDKAGNKSAAKTLTVKKDAVAPTANLTVSATSTKSITVRAAASDATSGLASVGTYKYYYKTSAASTYTLAETTTANTYTYPNLAQTTTYNLYVVVTDNAGLVTQTATINQATGTVPAGSGNVTLTPAWSSGTCKVTLGTSQTGYSIQYQIGSTTGTWTNYSLPVAVGLNQTIYARLWDGTNGGSTASLKVTDVIAPTAPTVAVSSGTAGTNSWYKSNITVKVTAGTDSQSGVARTTYTLTGASSKAETEISSLGTFTITADGTTTITAYTYDNAGNKSPAKTLTVKKDAVAPTASLAVSATTTKSITVKATASDSTSGLAAANTYKYYYKTSAASTYTLAATTTANTYTYSNLAQTTTYNLYVVVMDNAGWSVQSTTVNQATGTVPAGSGNITFTPGWSSGTCKVTLATSQSGYTIQYQVGSTTGTWNTYSSAVTVGLNQTIYARLTDGKNLGSTGSLKVTDTTVPTAPTIAVTAGTVGANSWYTTNVTVKVTAGTDSQSGVARTTYTLTGAQTLAETTIASGGTFTITADGTTTVTAYTYDNAGNKSAAKTLTVKKDASASSVAAATVSGETAGTNGYYTSNVTVKITAGSDSHSGVSRVSYALSGAQTLAETTITSGGTFSITVDGNTTVTCYTYNGAGLRSSAATLVVKKDATLPIPDTSIAGTMLYADPSFKSSVNGISVYNNSGNGTVTHTRKAMSDSPTGSGYGLEIKTAGTASPGFGGFTFGTGTAANKVYITRIIAKIPSGRSINFATNATGTGGSSKWLTSQAGTGAWQEYIFQLNCGSSGSFSSTNYFYLSGGSTPTASAPLIWQVAYATVYDTTKWGTSKNTIIKATDNIGIVGYGINQSSTAQPSFTSCSSKTSIATQIENQTANGTYYLWVKDIAGNVANKSFTVSYIDRTAPTASISPNGGGYVLPTGKTTATLKTRISATDTGSSGLTTAQYAWSTSNSTEPSSWTNFTASGQDITKTDVTAGNWYLWTRVIDSAGNRASTGKVSSAFNVISSSITLTPNTTAYTNGTVTVAVGYGTYLTQNRKAGLGSASTANATSVTITQNGTVYAEATDVAGNKVTASRAITNKIIAGMTMPQNMTFIGSTTGSYSNPIIPKGFAAINTGGATWGTSDGYTKGLVIQDQTGVSATNGSQFVWIPVTNYSNFVRKAGYYNGASDTAVNSCKEADLSSTYATVESKAMHNSVKANGGFYMARYEAGIASGMSAPSADTTATYGNGNYKPVSKAGVNVWNFIQWGSGSGATDKLAGNDAASGAVKAARGMYSGNSATTVHGTLTYGVQWDAAMTFLSDITNTTVSKPFIQNSNGMGTYNAQAVATTGKYVTKNIYDLGGNVNEWTMEGYSTTDRVFRGGYYYDAGGVRPASVRCYGLPNGYGGNVGFRVSLYI